MTENYYLKIGGTEALSEQLIADLASADADTKKKASVVLSERLKETRVRIGTLLKTDNVSFLIGAGASIKAGGIGLASIPAELERDLHKKAAECADGDRDWLSLFYSTSSALSGQAFIFGERRTALAGDLGQVPKIPLNLEDYLSHLHMWRACLNSRQTSCSTLLWEAHWLCLRWISTASFWRLNAVSRHWSISRPTARKVRSKITAA